MALAHVQTVKANGAGSAVLSVTTSGITTTTGNLFVIGAGSWKSGSPQTLTPSDLIGGSASGNTWLEVTGSPQNPSGNTRAHLFYCKNGNGGASHTFKVTAGATALMAMFLMEISGADTTAPYDTGAAATSLGSTAPNSGATGTRAQADEIIIGYCGTGDNVNGGTFSAGSGFTIPTNGTETNFNNYVSGIEYQIMTAVGTEAANFTISNDSWACIAAAFKAASGAAAIIFPDYFDIQQSILELM